MTATMTATTTTVAGHRAHRAAPVRAVRRDPTVRSRPRRRAEAVYRRRRAVVGACSAVIVALGAVVTHDVLAGSGGVPASAAASQPALVRSTITAQPGDTLWSIAGRQDRGDVAIGR
ncbi:MAG: LysM peptidoglycan-binding domain-containing protein, partial [Ilumatobacter sp.]|nr:LysM peptidoglycan-binding domain-containing protein [Ilumatobacter sp.]